jgi:type II secretory pathway component PulM
MKATEEESGQIKKWQKRVRQRDARIKELLKEIEELKKRRPKPEPSYSNFDKINLVDWV